MKSHEVGQDILNGLLEQLLEQPGDWTAQAQDGTSYEVQFSENGTEIVARNEDGELARYRLYVQVLPAGPSPDLDVVSLTTVINPDNRDTELVAIYTRGDHVVTDRDVKDLHNLYVRGGLACEQLPAALSWTDTCAPRPVETSISKASGLRCTIVGKLG